MKPKSKVIVMVPWMEVIGPFIRFEDQEGELLAEIGKHIIVLPIELKEALTPHLGRKIAILHTDIETREWLFRILAEDKMKDSCENEQASACCEVIG